jgi:hypothetical protein
MDLTYLARLRDLGVAKVQFDEKEEPYIVEFFSPTERTALDLADKIAALAKNRQGTAGAPPVSFKTEKISAQLAQARETGEPEEIRKLEMQLADAEAEALLYGSSD